MTRAVQMLPSRRKRVNPSPLASHVSTLQTHSSRHKCVVCTESTVDPENPLVLCRLCRLAVHAQCYGYPLSLMTVQDIRSLQKTASDGSDTPRSSWVCMSCMYRHAGSTDDDHHIPVVAPQEEVACALCPNTNVSMLKRTVQGSWCCLACAIFIPECFFRLPQGNDAIDISRVPQRRFGKRCIYCQQTTGACMDCTSQIKEDGCLNWFHITCGIKDNCIALQFIQSERKNESDQVLAYCHECL